MIEWLRWYKGQIALTVIALVLIVVGAIMHLESARECEAHGGRYRCWVASIIHNGDGTVTQIHECACFGAERIPDAGSW